MKLQKSSHHSKANSVFAVHYTPLKGENTAPEMKRKKQQHRINYICG